jgi:starch synthase
MGALQVLFVSSEIFPLAKTGGLADVAGALPTALSRCGADMHLMLPAYPAVLAQTKRQIHEVIELGDIRSASAVRLLLARMPDSGLPLWLVDCPTLFARPGGLYQDHDGRQWADNAVRFATLCHAAQRLAMGRAASGFRADIIHANDWHTGLLPLLMNAEVGARPGTVFTIHNLAYQGLFPFETIAQLGLPDPEMATCMEFYGQISLIKAGLSSADRLTTVSPSYAGEILTPEGGCGLDGLLRERASRLSGILNGIDYETWDPASDSSLPSTFSRTSIAGKRICKAAAQYDFGLEVRSDVPLIAFLSRLAHQKMADLVLEAIPDIMKADVQFALIGEGDPGLEHEFQTIAEKYSRRMAVQIGYDERAAHRLQAGADILLHPSRFEPCGLAPMYAMRYGTLPVVRRTGGLADLVIGADTATITIGAATGFAFADASREDMCLALDKALATYTQPLIWRKIQLEAMRQNFDWKRSAEEYLKLYQQLCTTRGSLASGSEITSDASARNTADFAIQSEMNASRLTSQRA